MAAGQVWMVSAFFKTVARWLPVAALAVIALAGSAVASQDGSAPAKHTAQDEAIEELPVIGERRPRGRWTIIDELMPPSLSGGVGIWRQDLCIAIRGVDDEIGRLIYDRIRALAETVDVVARLKGEPRCGHINASIVFDDDLPTTLMTDEVKKEINIKWRSTHNLDLRKDDRFGKPIRWVQAMDETDYRVWATSDRPIKSWFKTYPQRPPIGPYPTRLHADMTESLYTALIFIDIGRVVSLPMDAVGDSLGMILLAGIEPVPSGRTLSEVLALYSTPRNPAAQLGAFDRAYLSELYRTDHWRVESVHLKRVTVQRKLCEDHGYCKQPIEALE